MDSQASLAATSVDDHIVAVSRLSQDLLAELRTALERIVEVNRATSIISMNARVEAARVGVHGAAFSVIAEEMGRLSKQVTGVADTLGQSARRSGESMERVLGELSRDVREIRLCELALGNIDLVDRNLYERSCDVRWWASDAAAVAALQTPTPEALALASQRLGQILDSYTVYHDLVLADLRGRIVANGRPQRFQSVGADVSGSQWFRNAMATASGEEFGFESAHLSPLAGGERVLIYSCVVRAGGKVRGEPLGVLGIVFNWTSLAQTVVGRTPLSAAEWQRSRVCIVDDAGLVLADSDEGRIGTRFDFAGREALFAQPRGACQTDVDGRRALIAHAASPGYETYRTGWHSLLVQFDG